MLKHAIWEQTGWMWMYVSRSTNTSTLRFGVTLRVKLILYFANNGMSGPSGSRLHWSDLWLRFRQYTDLPFFAELVNTKSHK